ncbi:hypothetical protein MtrunA17_Chr4g0051131 [Medicago truncatula]|uniref:F-box associated beta-propeller type 1 domain-containing protein n=1 Tax=Medicago truncatula TaxID=3880 RepID=A0A396IAZ8_MEDTR|nr:hypothetical protein MtrunA17_Chr4g0051131 [Medicago truncatula]
MEPSYQQIQDVLEFLLRDVSLDSLWEVYSLRSNSWRKLDVDMPYSLECKEGTQVYMDEVCHWLCEDDYESSEKHNSPSGPCLVSFYLSNEVFFVTPIPSDLDDCFDIEADHNYRASKLRNHFILLYQFYFECLVSFFLRTYLISISMKRVII